MGVRAAGRGVSIIDIDGDLTGAAENALMDVYTRANAGSIGAIVLNFGRLNYLNSTGIGLLVTLLIRVNRQKQRLFAVGLSDHYRQIFELTRLDEAILIFDSEEQAVVAAEKR
jgi:anti-sigma B factor antagonist